MSGVESTGAVHSNCFSFVTAASQSAVQLTQFVPDFRVRSVSGVAVLAYVVRNELPVIASEA